jgi:hypothetical protein
LPHQQKFFLKRARISVKTFCLQPHHNSAKL